jgi:hypothetical protein
MQRVVHREIRRRVYRPRIADGVAVDSNGLRFEHAFSYLQSDLDALRAANAPPAGESQQDTDRE